MSFHVETLSEDQILQLFAVEENHFNDFKAKEIDGKKLSKSISAFANASGGDIYVGTKPLTRKTAAKRC